MLQILFCHYTCLQQREYKLNKQQNHTSILPLLTVKGTATGGIHPPYASHMDNKLVGIYEIVYKITGGEFFSELLKKGL